LGPSRLCLQVDSVGRLFQNKEGFWKQGPL
jgi:hypothetical protein